MNVGKWHLKLNMTVVSLLLGGLFGAAVWTVELWRERADVRLVEEHAQVVSSSLWNFDAQGPVDYLHIAMRLHNYERMTIVALPNDFSFIHVQDGPPGRMDRWLMRMGLIRHREMSTPIYYQHELIGRLDVVHVNKRVYSYLYWFLVVCLAWVGMKFFLQMLRGKQLLEIRVAERTAELRASEERLMVTLNSIGDSVIAADLHGIVIGLNPAAAVLTGWTQGAAVGRKFKEVCPVSPQNPQEKPLDPVDFVLKAGRRVGLVSRAKLRTRTQQQYLVAVSGSPIRKTETGDVMGVVFVLRDITEEVALQERLKQSEKMQAIGQLAGGIAHDFNNMLAIIMGAEELLRMIVPASPDAEKYLNLLSSAAGTAAGLTKQLLVFSRQSASSSEVVDLDRMVGDTASLLESTIDRRIDVRRDLAGGGCRIRGDRSVLQSALLNMGINAAHSISGCGAITYRTREVELDGDTCSRRGLQLQPGRYVEISILDTGCGIAPEVLPHIFEPFFTAGRNGKGTGLGLAVVEAAVQQHGGVVAVSSAVGEGSCFRVYLPPVRADQPGGSGLSQKSGDGSETILLVDDEAAIREMTGAMLEMLGYRVIAATNGREGVNQFRKHAGEIDLVLLDMVMPEMNGRDCFFELRKIRPDLRVVLCSGFSMQEEVEEMIKNGLCGVLQKPFRKDELADMVYRALHS